MATTSSNLTVGKEMSGQSRTGKGYKGRVAGLVATAALGLSLLAGLTINQAVHVKQPDAAPASSNLASIPTAPNHDWAISDGIRPGLLEPPSSAGDFVPDEFTYREDPLTLAIPMAADYGWAISNGTRPGLLELSLGDLPALPFVPDQFTYREDHLAVHPAAASAIGTCIYASAAGVPGEGCTLAFIPDQFTYREDHRAVRPAVASATDTCIYASAAGVPGEGCTPAFIADQFTYHEDHRASAGASVTSFLPVGARFQVYA